MPSDHNFDRRDTDANSHALATRMNAVEKWCETMDLELKANTVLTKQVHANTENIVELMASAKEMWEFLTKWGKRFAIFAKYVGYVAGAIAAVWAVLNLRR